MRETEQCIRQFVIDNFLFGEDEPRFSNDASLLRQGIIDSTGVLELVAFVETEFGIQLTDKELVPANLDSVDQLVRFIDTKLRACG